MLKLMMDTTLPKWPQITLANDREHPGLQVADVLTYFATKQFVDREIGNIFDFIRPKTHFMTYQFDDQIGRPYEPPPGVIAREMPRKQ